jgi:hypothetical protein
MGWGGAAASDRGYNNQFCSAFGGTRFVVSQILGADDAAPSIVRGEN